MRANSCMPVLCCNSIMFEWKSSDIHHDCDSVRDSEQEAGSLGDHGGWSRERRQGLQGRVDDYQGPKITHWGARQGMDNPRRGKIFVS